MKRRESAVREGCVKLAAMSTRNTKTHTSSRNKKRTAAKVSKSIGKSASKRKAAETDRWKEIEKLTLKMFDMVYEDYQQGKFRRLF